MPMDNIITSEEQLLSFARANLDEALYHLRACAALPTWNLLAWSEGSEWRTVYTLAKAAHDLLRDPPQGSQGDNVAVLLHDLHLHTDLAEANEQVRTTAHNLVASARALTGYLPATQFSTIILLIAVLALSSQEEDNELQG